MAVRIRQGAPLGDIMKSLMKKHKSREFGWHPDRSWQRHFDKDIKKFYYD